MTVPLAAIHDLQPTTRAWERMDGINKKLSYCWETARRESLPKIAEMDVDMTTWTKMTFKCTARSSKVAPTNRKSVCDFLLVVYSNFAVSRTVYEKFDVKQSNDLEISPRSSTVVYHLKAFVWFLICNFHFCGGIVYNFRDTVPENDNIG